MTTVPDTFLPRPSKTRTMAMANQKGGVGKTTVTAGVAEELADRGRRVLVIDADPQANATAQLGLGELDAEDRTLADVLAVDPALGHVRPGGAVHAILPAGSPWPQGLRVIPSELGLANREQDQDVGREFRLRTALEGVLDGPDRIEVDVVLIDCPPSLGQLTVNALAVADGALLITEPRASSVEGLAQMVRTVATVRRALNPGLALAGVVVNRYRGDRRDRVEWLGEVMKHYDQLVIDPLIPEREAVAQAASAAVPLTQMRSVDVKHVRLALQAIARQLTAGGGGF